MKHKGKKLSFEDKEKAVEQKRQTIINQGGVCFVCHKPFTSSDPPEASHRIIRKYETIYGYEVINHPLNVPVCHKTCNSSVILSPYKQSGKDLIQSIIEDLQ